MHDEATVAFQAFLEAAGRAPAVADGFTQSDVRRLVEYWVLLDDETDMFGYIVELVDGRRVYVEQAIEHGKPQQQPPAVETLAPGMERPDLGPADVGVRWQPGTEITMLLQQA